MSVRASIFGTGAPGGNVDYRGDVPAPVTSYASAAANTPLIARLNVPPSTNKTKSAVVSRHDTRGDIRFFYSHGAVTMRAPLAAIGPGTTPISQVQQRNIQLMDWQINGSWAQTGYPRNFGWSTRVPQLTTNVTGGPGPADMNVKPHYARVQAVPRSRVIVRSYPTKGQ